MPMRMVGVAAAHQTAIHRQISWIMRQKSLISPILAHPPISPASAHPSISPILVHPPIFPASAMPPSIPRSSAIRSPNRPRPSSTPGWLRSTCFHPTASRHRRLPWKSPQAA